VLGNPANRRVKLFDAALRDMGQTPPEVISYRDLLRGEDSLEEYLARFRDEPCILRIESPAEDHDVERRLIAKGSAVGAISAPAALRLRQDIGRVRFVRQWYAGFSALLAEIEETLRLIPNVSVQNHPRDIRMLFDKPRCHALLASRGIAVSPSLPAVDGYDGLREAMRAAGWQRVFVKLAWGSSASGVVALNTELPRPLAITSLELVRRGGEARFYNNLRLSTYQRERELRAIFDFLCREGAHVEQWLPKAARGTRNFDLRVVTFAGRACHTVVRTSRSPITNLHLGNKRGDVSLLQRAAGRRWRDIRSLCEQAAAVLPQTQYIGWDVLVTPGFRKSYILEGNAFGDLLPNVLHRGRSTHEEGIRAALRPRMGHALCDPAPAYPGGEP
jgi:hypothetical protein